jgi:hypothetical protein
LRKVHNLLFTKRSYRLNNKFYWFRLFKYFNFI